MKYYPLWTENKRQGWPSVDQNINTDILIVGGGLAGVSTLYHLTSFGYNCVLVEKDILASGLTGKSGGILSALHLEERMVDYIAKVGEEKAVSSLKHTSACVDLIGDIAAISSPFDFKRCGSLFYATKKRSLEPFKEEAVTRGKYFSGTKFLAGRYLDDLFEVDNCICVIVSDDDASINPAAFVNVLAGVAHKARGRIFEHSNVNKIDFRNKAADINGYKINYDKLVLANDIGAASFGVAEAMTLPVQEYVAVSRPLTERELRRYPEGRSIWDEGQYIYTYARLTPDNRILVGGKGACLTVDKNGRKSPQLFHKPLRLYKKYLQEFFEISDIDYYWRGQINYPIDERPFIGQYDDNSYIALYTRCLLHAFLSGKILTDLISSGQSEHKELFDPHRKLPLRHRARRIFEHFPFNHILYQYLKIKN